MYFPGALRSPQNRAATVDGDSAASGAPWQTRRIRNEHRQPADRLLERLAAHGPLPRVRALHLPPSSGATGKNGEFCARTRRRCAGLSFVMLDDTLARLHRGMSRAQLCGGRSDAPRTAPGAAPPGQGQRQRAQPRPRGAQCAEPSLLRARVSCRRPAVTRSARMDLQPGERIGMVGYFRPRWRGASRRWAPSW